MNFRTLPILVIYVSIFLNRKLADSKFHLLHDIEFCSVLSANMRKMCKCVIEQNASYLYSQEKYLYSVSHSFTVH